MGKEDGNAWKERLATFDFEVTAYDWLVVVKIKQTGEYYSFHNDPIGLEKFIAEHDYIYVGYNNKHYDNYILKGVLHHYIPEDIKKINDWIIAEGRNGWEYPFEDKYLPLPPTSDLILDMPLRQSLKELEGNMCMDIQESTIDFNIDHPWTKEEFEEMLFYCKHDVDATERLIDERMGYLEAKASVAELIDMSVEKALYSTNAQLAAIYLEAQREEHDDEREFEYPQNLKYELIPNQVVSFFNNINDKSISDDKLFNKKLKIDLCDIEWCFGFGGVHASVENYEEESEE